MDFDLPEKRVALLLIPDDTSKKFLIKYIENLKTIIPNKQHTDPNDLHFSIKYYLYDIEIEQHLHNFAKENLKELLNMSFTFDSTHVTSTTHALFYTPVSSNLKAIRDNLVASLGVEKDLSNFDQMHENKAWLSLARWLIKPNELALKQMRELVKFIPTDVKIEKACVLRYQNKFPRVSKEHGTFFG